MARRPPSAGSVPSSGAAHLIELVRHTVPPVHPEALRFVAAPAAVAVLGRRHAWVRTPAAVASVAVAAFFRHPKRVPPLEPDVVVAPADGEITLVDKATPPPELGWGYGEVPRVSTFLSLFDVHVQRIPVTGTISGVHYRPGSFLSADLPDASVKNERNTVVIQTNSQQRLAVVQIAGLLARRIRCDVHSGDRVEVGDTYGLIRFGSRLDVYFPPGTVCQARVGQRAVGGETILAQLP